MPTREGEGIAAGLNVVGGTPATRAKERRKIEVIIQSWQLSTLRRSDRFVVAATGLSLHVFPGWEVVGRAFAILRLGPGGEIGGSE
jgi:hypothetical protein